MKEQSASGHGNVVTPAASSRTDHGRQLKHSDNNNQAKCFGGPCLDTDEDEEWEEDLGIGKLVIDLDADADKTRSPPSVKSSTPGHNSSASLPSMSTANISPQKAGGGNKSAMESSLAHSSDKGLKMKIKRSNSGKSTASLSTTAGVVGPMTGQCKSDNRHESKPSDNRLSFSGSTDGNSSLQNSVERVKHSLSEKERSGSASSKNRGSSKKDRGSKSKGGSNNDAQHSPGASTVSISQPPSSQTVTIATTSSAAPGVPSSTVTSNVTVDLDRISMTPFGGSSSSIKRENPSHDPYEFNAKVEDRIGVPMKKMKVEKLEPSSSSPTSTSPIASVSSERREPPVLPTTTTSPQPSELQASTPPEQRDMAVGTSHVGVITEPDCLGPCEPGTSVVLEGIVWNETDNGLLVVNVTWRGKTYVGTLMDATKHDWAPPRLNCDSPTEEIDSRTPKGRGKRGRGAGPPPKPIDNGSDRKLRSTRRNQNNNGNMFCALPSPARLESLGAKRKARSEPDPAMFEPPKPNKRTRTDSRMSDYSSTSTSNDSQLIECPEPNCSKKYRHINGLKYHQSHAHKDSYGDGVGMDLDSGSCKDEKSSHNEHSPPASVSEAMIQKPDETSSKKKTESRAEAKVTDVPTTIKVKEEPMEEGNGKTVIEKGKDSKDERTATDKMVVATPEAKKIVKQANVPVAAVSISKNSVSVTGNNPVTALKGVTNSTPIAVSKPAVSVETTVSTGTAVYKISGGQIGLVTSNVSVVTQAPSQIVVSTSTLGAESVPVSAAPVTVSALTSLPVVVSTLATTKPITTTSSPSKHEGEKKKKSEKHRNKSSSSTRPIMPAPSTPHMNITQTPISTQAGVSQVNTVPSQLKPIQPKPTVLGETNKVNPALASLKEMKEKKPKKKKKDKDRERHKDGSKSHHEHKSKVSMPSVIKTAPSAPVQKSPDTAQQVAVHQHATNPPPKLINIAPSDPKLNQMGQQRSADAQQKVLIQRPVESQQKVVLIPADSPQKVLQRSSDVQQKVVVQRQADSQPKVLTQRPVDAQQKGVVPRPIIAGQPKVVQRPAEAHQKVIRVPNTEVHHAKLVPVTVSEVQLRDISAPPQLEKQQPVNLVKDRVAPHPARPLQTLAPVAKLPDGSNPNKANQEQDAHSPAYSDISDANESAPTLEKETQPTQSEPPQSERPPSVQTQEYSSYYGQPPFLTPAVPPASQDGKTVAPVIVKTVIKTEVKECVKSRPPSTPSPVGTERKEGGSRPPSTTPQGQQPGQEQKPASSPVSQQQKAVYPPGQYPYGQYYGMDPNYVQLYNNPEYRERIMEEQRRRQEQMQQQHRQSQGAPQLPPASPHSMVQAGQAGPSSTQVQPPQQQAPSNAKVSTVHSQHSPQQKQQPKQQPKPQNHHAPQIQVSNPRQPSPHSQQHSRQPSPHGQQQSQQPMPHGQQQPQQPLSHGQQQSQQPLSHGQQQSQQPLPHGQQLPQQPLPHGQQLPQQPSQHGHHSRQPSPHGQQHSRQPSPHGQQQHPNQPSPHVQQQHPNLPSPHVQQHSNQPSHVQQHSSQPSPHGQQHSGQPLPHGQQHSNQPSSHGQQHSNQPLQHGQQQHSSQSTSHGQQNSRQPSPHGQQQSRQPSPHGQHQHSPQIKHKQPQSRTPQPKPQHPGQNIPHQNQPPRPNNSSVPQQQQQQQQPGHHQSTNHKSHSATKSRPQSSDPKGDQNRRPKEEPKPVEERTTPVQKPPPSLISDREREEQKRRDRERSEHNLREKQNENRQILKENIELKEQMDNRKFEPYDSKVLMDKQREELQRYYMFHQQRYLEHQRYSDVMGGPETSGKPMTSPCDKSEMVDGKPPPKGSRYDQDGKDHPKVKDEERPRSVDRSSAASSPRTTPKLKDQGPGQSPGTPGHLQVIPGGPPVSYAQYYSQYMQQPHNYGGHMQFDPAAHPGMYPGVNPVIGYAGPAFIHPSQLRYHVPNNGEPIQGEKMMMMSPGAMRPEGAKAIDLLQQHAQAAQYYNAANTQHKIHELQDVAKRADKARMTGSPATKETERPSSRSSVGPETPKSRDSRLSPPTQRHLHTHHHTHVMGAPTYPAMQYDPYGAAIITSPTGPPAIQSHPFVQK